MELKIVSGCSGAGKSVALRVLEDQGYYCVDNLPVTLLPEFIKVQPKTISQVAVSIDIRNMPEDPSEVTKVLSALPSSIDVDLFFLDAEEKELIKRYSETRRLHPLSRENLTLEQSIVREKQLLLPLKERADRVIDSTGHSIHDLSEAIRSLVLGRNSKDLVMVFESFGFKHGIPTDADFVYDVRFLPNPHWEPALRPLTGLDEPVKLYLAAESDVSMLIAQIKSFLEFWLPALENNNRSYLTVAIGCTGGQHRSVYVAQHLADYFGSTGQQVQIRHRTLEGKV